MSEASLKAEAARLECEEDGASDVEALFASQEDAKPPTILAAEAGYIKSGSGSFISITQT
ncbi:hypothetical protein COK05_26095 [Bacillus cereus]|uniref:Uncharacterized protein n=1 Tax=Bacillus cereus TaxID=1396 RepID=A0A2B2LE08_BACCE|nr:hypothetical protein COK05_26095 [Bacillus cereus]